MDRDQKPDLITIIERLLADRTTLVVGSAVMAFSEVCPERSDLIHKVYRKLCTLLVDVDEWGQVVILNMLTRYARMHFADPNLNVSIIHFYTRMITINIKSKNARYVNIYVIKPSKTIL